MPMLIYVIKKVAIIQPSNVNNSFALIISVGVVLMCFIIIIIYTNKQEWTLIKNQKLFPLFFGCQVINLLLQRIFFIPFFIGFFSLLQSNNNGTLRNYPDALVNEITINNYVYIPIASICLTVFSVFIILNLLFFNDFKPVTLIPWAAPLNVSSTIQVVLKLILAIFFVFDFGYIVIKAILVLLIVITLIILRLVKPLYHNQFFFNFETVLEGSFLFNTICSFIHIFDLLKLSYFSLSFQILTSIGIGFIYLKIIVQIQTKLVESNVNIKILNIITLLSLLSLFI